MHRIEEKIIFAERITNIIEATTGTGAIKLLSGPGYIDVVKKDCALPGTPQTCFSRFTLTNHVNVNITFMPKAKDVSATLEYSKNGEDVLSVTIPYTDSETSLVYKCGYGFGILQKEIDKKETNVCTKIPIEEKIKRLLEDIKLECVEPRSVGLCGVTQLEGTTLFVGRADFSDNENLYAEVIVKLNENLDYHTYWVNIMAKEAVAAPDGLERDLIMASAPGRLYPGDLQPGHLKRSVALRLGTLREIADDAIKWFE